MYDQWNPVHGKIYRKATERIEELETALGKIIKFEDAMDEAMTRGYTLDQFNQMEPGYIPSIIEIRRIAEQALKGGEPNGTSKWTLGI